MLRLPKGCELTIEEDGGWMLVRGRWVVDSWGIPSNRKKCWLGLLETLRRVKKEDREKRQKEYRKKYLKKLRRNRRKNSRRRR